MTIYPECNTPSSSTLVYHDDYNHIEPLGANAYHQAIVGSIPAIISGSIEPYSTMASRSPTLRASSDPFGPDAEKDVQTLDNSNLHGAARPDIAPGAEKRRRSSLGAAFRRQSEYKEVDPFDDEDGDGVKYRTLKWWYASVLL